MSGAHWTPYQIRIILHHNTSTAPFPEWTAPAYEPTVADLVERDILEPNEADCITTTERGKVFVQMLLNTPLPENKWIDPRDGKEVMQETAYKARGTLFADQQQVPKCSACGAVGNYNCTKTGCPGAKP